MSDTTTSGDRTGAAEIGETADTDGVVDVVADEIAATVPGASAAAIVGRSPGQLAWMRLKRDRVARFGAITILVYLIVVIVAPLFASVYGSKAETQSSELLDQYGAPLGVVGGISGAHWLGLTPGKGEDLLLQIVFGLRTSLLIAFSAAIISTAIGIVIGIIAGYAGGWIDKVLTWFTDMALAFPFFLFALAIIPVINTRLENQFGDIAPWKRILTIILVFSIFGWMYTARLVRGQVISLREREYVEAARAAGAGTGHMLFRQLLPNLWAPIMVTFSLAVPAYVIGEAALSFLNIGVLQPTPDLGRLIFASSFWLDSQSVAPLFVWLPGVSIFLLVLAFNLFGDSLRDALDPKSLR
jgi:peptide/nickel transport system permease protein